MTTVKLDDKFSQLTFLKFQATELERMADEQAINTVEFGWHMAMLTSQIAIVEYLDKMYRLSLAKFQMD